MEKLRPEIRRLYEEGLGCRKIGDELGLSHVVVWKNVKKMGILRSKEEARTRVSNDGKNPFLNPPGQAPKGSLAMIKAMEWFLDRNYMVSVPVEPSPYDLVVESPNGFQRIQVKRAGGKSQYGVWRTGIVKKRYDPDVNPSALGKVAKVPYSVEEVDFFFILDGEGQSYLIPIHAVEGMTALHLDNKYAEFRV